MATSRAMAQRSTSELVVLLYGAPIGTLRCDRHAKLSFVYADEPRSARHAVPLSLSLPLARREHGHDAVDAFLWGLLPDNENVLARWGREFHVSSRNPFALLAHVGEDCAGAVQIVPPERLDEIAGPGPVRVDWLGHLEIAERLHALRNDETAWSRADDGGRFSLAGAQPKVAMFYDGKRWGIPIGRTPTTHILKPPTGAFDGQIENEHFCLQLARKLGMPTAISKIVRFESETAIVLERYDRMRMPSETGRAALGKAQPVLRLHQEDMCQALAVRPQAKYQNEGGPSPERIADLLRDHSDEPRQDLHTFLDALLFNWLIGGSDAHAKNYSLLHGAGGHVRLAPLYDVASALPYPSLNTPRLKLAMELGGHYRLREIGAPELSKLATNMKVSHEAALERAGEMCARMPKATREIADACARDGLDHPILEQLVVVLSDRAQRCEERLR